MEAYLNKEYDYSLFICPKTYGSFIDVARALKVAVGAGGKYSNYIRNNTGKCKEYSCFGAHTYAYNYSSERCNYL